MTKQPYVPSRLVSTDLLARSADPQPPFQVRGVEMVYLEGRMDPQQARPLLPDWLRPAQSGAIDIAVYTAPEGWGPTPYTSCYIRIALADYLSPDGGNATLTLAETVSPPAAAIFARHYNSECFAGSSSMQISPDAVAAEGELAGGGHVLIRARRTHAPTTATAGSYPEIARHGAGYIEYTTAYSCLIEPLALEVFDLSFPPGHPLQIVRDHFEPVEIALLREKSFANGIPRPAQTSGRGSADPAPALVDLIGRLNLPALIFRMDGRVVHVSAAAERLGSELDSVVGLVRHTAFRRSDAETFQDHSLPLTLRDGRAEVIRLIPLAASLWGQPVVLCVLADLARLAVSDPLPVLGLVGLTPAEARIASLLARGASAPKVAGELGLSPHTVRSTLKGIYGKLDVNSRAELAIFVERLVGHLA